MSEGDNRREGSENMETQTEERKKEIRQRKRTIVPALLLVCVPSVLAGCKAVVCKSLREVIHARTLRAPWKGRVCVQLCSTVGRASRSVGVQSGALFITCQTDTNLH